MSSRPKNSSQGATSQRRNDPAGVRGRILDAAFDLFQSQGYSATSVHEIALRARVTGGALHHHFPIKKTIGLAVIEERVKPALEETWLQPVRASFNARSVVIEVFDTLADELDNRGQVRGCPVNNLTLELSFVDAEFRSALRELFDSWQSTLRELFRESNDPAGRAALVVACYSGAMALAKAEQRGDPLRLCARQLESLL